VTGVIAAEPIRPIARTMMLMSDLTDPHGGARTPIQIAEHFDVPRILEQLRSAPPPPF
jgi:hypothetical protein